MTTEPPDEWVVAPTGERFSSFKQIASQFARDGTVSSVQALTETRDDLLVEVLFKWYQEGQLACQYARHLAGDAKKAGWLTLVLQPDFDAHKLASSIDILTRQSEAIQLIFRECVTPADAAQLVAKLCSTGRWWCVDVSGDQNTSKIIPIGLRWIPQTESHTSWVLGIAPFTPMPFTRRFVGAPFTVLVFRPGPPTNRRNVVDPTTGQSAAHLAHMNVQGSSQLMRALENGTRDTRLAHLRTETADTARARVTLALPDSCRRIVARLFATARVPGAGD